VDAPSASIPAVTFVITAILPARSHQGNQGVGSELRIVAVKEPDQRKERFIPKTYCKSFATTTENAADAAECHRLVTSAQHREMETSRPG
jgi:hypothetical protein